jgi:hypothetical protein
MLTHHGITYAALSLPSSVSAVDSSSAAPTRLRVTVGPQHGSWHLINEEMSNLSVTKDVFQLGLDLGPAPVQNASAAYGVFPGSTPKQVSAVLKELTVVANNEQRQVVARHHVSTPSQPHVVMAVVYSGGSVFTKAELGYDLTTNSSIILAITSQDPQQQDPRHHGSGGSGGGSISVAFSRPIGGGGTVRLVVSGATEGWAAARELRTMAAATDTSATGAGAGAGAAGEAGGGAVVTCHTVGSSGQHIIDLQLPVAPGRTAQGSCAA